MATTYDIQRLCELSWKRLAEATRDDHHRLAERFLAQLGWESPDPLSLLPFGVEVPTVSYLLPAGNQRSLATHFLSPGLLEPPSAHVHRGLDYCDVTRHLVDVTAGVGANYAFITDFQRSSLYDVDTDELLLHADVPAEFAREFGTVLSRDEVVPGLLDDIRRQPRSFVARQLREWIHRWTSILVEQARMNEDKAQHVMDRLVVLRYLFYHDILNPEEWDLENRVADLLMRAIGPHPRGTGRQLRQLFSDLWTDWRADLFRPDFEIDEVIQHDALAVPLLREYALLSQSKFQLATILESFNYGEAAEKARVRTIPEEHPGRAAYLGRLTLDTVHDARIELDIDEEGYRTVFHWFDRLVETYERLEVESQARARRASSGMLQGLSVTDYDGVPGSFDKFRHAVEQGLTIYYATPRQLRTSRLLLYLHVINCYEESGGRFAGFPQFQATFQPRPRILDSDRQRIYSPTPEQYEEWEVI